MPRSNWKRLWMLAMVAWILVFAFLAWTSHRHLPEVKDLWKENAIRPNALLNKFEKDPGRRPSFSAVSRQNPLKPAEIHQQQPVPAKSHEQSQSTLLLSSPSQVIKEGCRAPPGDANSIEGSHMGYQVFVRMRYGLLQDPRRARKNHSSNHTSSILCVVPLLSTEREQTILETYGSECDGILLIRHAEEQQSSPNFVWSPNTTSTSEEELPTIHSFEYPQSNNPHDHTQARLDLMKLMSSLSYDWIHWGSKEYYFVPGLVRAYLGRLQEQSQLEGVQFLDHYRLLNASDWKKYQDLYGKKDNPLPCFPAVLFHQSALSNLQRNIVGSSTTDRSPTKKTFENLSDWITHEIQQGATNSSTTASSASLCTSVVPSTQRDYFSAWQFLKRYFEIRAPRKVDMYRIHAIQHDQCPFPEVDALDQDGRPGYVANVTYLRSHAPSLTDLSGVCKIPPGEGDEGPDGYKGLKKISTKSTIQQRLINNPQRVLCMVYTHEGRHERYLRAVAETWASHCDGFFAASTVTDPNMGAVQLLHEGPELYENMWMKIMAMFKYAYKHYRNDFDFFHIGGDDMYVIGENLKYTVSTGNWNGPWNQSEPLFLGGSLPLWKQRRYCGGGSGYTINRPALDLLMKLSNTPRCWPHMQSSDEDRIMSSCFRQVNFMQCTDTNDDKNETRYHAWHAQQHAAWRPGQPCQDCHDLPKNHGIAWKEGLGQISETSVSFHLKNPDAKSADSGMRRYHAILYGLCEPKK